MSRVFPWAEYMRLGIGVLRLSPAAFWAASPREIAAAFPTVSPFTRARFDALMQQFPDET